MTTEVAADMTCPNCDAARSSEPGACPNCGAKHYSVVLRAEARAGAGMRLEHHRPAARTNKPKSKRAIRVIEDYTEETWDRGTRDRVTRDMDREGDWYSEVIRDGATGEVLHTCEEPLSNHRGHGDAKRKR